MSVSMMVNLHFVGEGLCALPTLSVKTRGFATSLRIPPPMLRIGPPPFRQGRLIGRQTGEHSSPLRQVNLHFVGKVIG